MRVLATSDWQVGAGAKYGRVAHGPGSRLHDQAMILGEIASVASSRQVDLILHCGDVCQTRTPSVPELLVAKDALDALADIAPVLVVCGNHDRRGAEGPATPELFAGENVRVSLNPEVLDIAGVQVCTLPWAPVSHYIAQHGRDHDINAAVADQLVRVAEDLRGQCDPGRPAVLVLHWWVEGATTAHGVGQQVINEPVIPWQPLEEQGWSLVVAGHVHKPQLLGGAESKMPGFYCGPPSTTDFGEAEEHSGVWFIDTDRLPGWTPEAFEFVPLPDRPFVTMEYGVESWADIIDGRADGGEDFDGAVIRARVRATQDEFRRVDVIALRERLYGYGAHVVFVEPRIEQAADRRRVETVDETLAPLAAVNAWLRANGMVEGEGEAECATPAAMALLDYTADRIESVA